MSFQPIKKLIPLSIRSHGLSKQVNARQALETAVAVIKSMWGEEKAGYLSPVSFKEGILKMESVSAVAMQQFKVDEIKILNEVNRRIGERLVLKMEVRSKGF